MIERAPATAPSEWSPLRFFAWTTLLVAMVFWGTLIVLG